MRNSNSKRAKRRGVRRGRKRITINENKLVNLYLQGLSVRAIATQLGLSRSVVHRWLQMWRCVSDDKVRAAFLDDDFQDFDDAFQDFDGGDAFQDF